MSLFGPNKRYYFFLLTGITLVSGCSSEPESQSPAERIGGIYAVPADVRVAYEFEEDFSAALIARQDQKNQGDIGDAEKKGFVITVQNRADITFSYDVFQVDNMNEHNSQNVPGHPVEVWLCSHTHTDAPDAVHVRLDGNVPYGEKSTFYVSPEDTKALFQHNSSATIRIRDPLFAPDEYVLGIMHVNLQWIAPEDRDILKFELDLLGRQQSYKQIPDSGFLDSARYDIRVRTKFIGR